MASATSHRSAELAKLVERQMRFWELSRSQQTAAAPPRPRAVHDFICISRSVGAGAGKIAFLLGERLGWPVLDKEILHCMADDDALRERIYASLDERDMGWAEEAMRALGQPGFERNDYFRRLTRTVLSLARRGSAVFVGRGSDLILPRETGLRVRIVAPMQKRVFNTAQRLGISEQEAREEVARLERDRTQYVRTHFNVDVANSERYDLVINVDRFSAIDAVGLIMAARDLAQCEDV